MGWMKAIYTDIQELNERVLDIYSENVADNPDDAIAPLGEYLSEAGWKAPTEMLAVKQGIIEQLRLVYGKDQGAAHMARGELILELVSAFDISIDEVLPRRAEAALEGVNA